MALLEGRENLLLESALLWTHRKPSLATPPPSAKPSVLSDLRILKELISSTRHFSIPSIGYELQIKPNRSIKPVSVQLTIPQRAGKR